MSSPRLVATDLDGTLIPADGDVSDVTADVLSRLDRRGIPVVFVTARPLRWMDGLWPHVGAHGVAIVSNGAIVYDVPSRTARSVTGIEPGPGLALVDALTQAVPGVTFAIECADGIRHDPDYADLHEVPDGTPRGPLQQLWTDPAVKLLVRHEQMEASEFREQVAATVGDAATPTWTMDGLVEISAAGITKGAALAQLCADRGIDAQDVVAFGDMPNDIPMLAWAGTSYAVTGAHPSVIEAADHVAPGPDEDGVARVLAGMFDL